jgi:hypothetical protein
LPDRVSTITAGESRRTRPLSAIGSELARSDEKTFDVVRPEARGTTAGFMNLVGWLGGGAIQYSAGENG